MSFTERALRALTHFNVGAALAIIAWLLWTMEGAIALHP